MRIRVLVGRALLLCGVGLMVGLLPGRTLAQEGDASKLVGTKKCAMCHRKDSTGNQYGIWKKLSHAKAFEVLASAEAKEVGAKMGIEDPQASGKCLKCHSTAYYFTEERQSEAVAVEDGVSCESCHGPGADYKKKSVMADHDASVAAGMIYPAKEKRCTLCHNKENPTWKADRYTTASGEKVDFDVEQAYEKIKHERPDEP